MEVIERKNEQRAETDSEIGDRQRYRKTETEWWIVKPIETEVKCE